MLEKFEGSNEFLGGLIKEGLIESLFYREKLRAINYYDIVPLLNEEYKKRFKITSKIHVGGKGFGLDYALNSCLGEVIERVSLMKEIDIKRFEIKNGKLDQFFSKKELKRFNLNKSLEVPMIKLKNYLDNSYLEVPLEIIFPNCSKKFLPKCSSSVGTSFEKTKEGAILNGLFEYIERHSLLKSWYSDKRIRLLRNSPIEISKLLNLIKTNLEIKIDLYVIPCDFSCNVICSKIDFKGGCVFGCSADLSLKNSCNKAIAESLQLLTSTKFLNKKPEGILEKYFLRLIKDPHLKFIESFSKDRGDFQLEDLINSFKSKNKGIYSVNITPKELAKYGFVFKLFIPSLLQFGSKESIIFKTNSKLIRDQQDKKINPFV